MAEMSPPDSISSMAGNGLKSQIATLCHRFNRVRQFVQIPAIPVKRDPLQVIANTRKDVTVVTLPRPTKCFLLLGQRRGR